MLARHEILGGSPSWGGPPRGRVLELAESDMGPGRDCLPLCGQSDRRLRKHYLPKLRWLYL